MRNHTHLTEHNKARTELKRKKGLDYTDVILGKLQVSAFTPV